MVRFHAGGTSSIFNESRPMKEAHNSKNSTKCVLTPLSVLKLTYFQEYAHSGPLRKECNELFLESGMVLLRSFLLKQGTLMTAMNSTRRFPTF